MISLETGSGVFSGSGGREMEAEGSPEGIFIAPPLATASGVFSGSGGGRFLP